MFNGFMTGWWKMSFYSKWYHYFWLMPIIAVWAAGLFIARKFFNY